MEFKLFLIFIQLVNVYSLYSIKECNDNLLKCYNGGSCIQIAINLTSTVQVCNCKAGYTGRQCEQITMPCSPDPCAPNGYCNSGTIDQPVQDKNIYISSTDNYFCRCKPGFTGYNCKENINDCINASCANGGLCIDGINSYTCDCPWPYTGRYCETRLSCASNYCKNNSTCVEEYNHNRQDFTTKCICENGYEGIDCAIKLDACHKRPCLFGGICVSNDNDYTCKCPLGRLGKNCELMDVCYIEQPCKNNSTCIQLDLNENQADTSNIETIAVVESSATTTTTTLNQPKFICQCKPNYTGTNCDIYINHNNNCINGQCQNSVPAKILSQITTTTILNAISVDSATPVSSTLSELPLPSNNLLNGSFVLILNLTPDEFKRRKYEIIQEFSKQLGIFMLIKKDSNSQEMIYPYEYSPNNDKTTSSTKKILWTKVYFIIIFACIDQNGVVPSAGSTPNGNICLNDLNSLNDIFNFVTKLRQATNLPNYVSNITYEANEIKSDISRNGAGGGQSLNNPTIIIGIVVSVLVIIIALLGMIVRQQQVKNRLIKAPIWFPPYSANDKPLDINTNQANQNPQSAAMTPHTNASSWSFQTSVKNFFKMNSHGPDSPQSDENGSTSSEKPLKMRKIENNNLITSISTRDSSTPLFQNNSTNSSSNCTTTSEYLSTSLSPPPLNSMGCIDLYYPSPPESLPDYYSNIKGPLGLTPLMCIIMNTKAANSSTMVDLIDALVSKGADINAVNNSNGETALHLAVRNGLYDISEKLMNYGADIGVHDKHGRNVLHTAVGSNQYAIIKLLFLKYGDKIDIDAKTSDNIGETALISAARNHFNDIIKLLISYNVTINSTDNNGQSALHWCAKVNNCQGAILLLENGANINLQDENEKTPLSVAIDELNTNEIIQLLIKYQAFVSSEDEKLLEFKQKLSNNNKNINYLKQYKESNIIAAANIAASQQQIARQPSIKIEKESLADNPIGGTNTNRKRKLNNTDISVTNNKASKTTRNSQQPQKVNESAKQTTQVPLAQQIKLKSENNLATSTPCGTLKNNSNELHMSKSIQENMNHMSTQQQQLNQVLSSSQYNNYDYLTNINTLANKNLTTYPNYNNLYPAYSYQQSTQQAYPYQKYDQQYLIRQQDSTQQPQPQPPQQQQQQQQECYYSDPYNNYQQQNYSNYYSSNTLLTANTTNTAYF